MRLAEHVSAAGRSISASVGYLEQAFLKIFENALDACADPVEIEIRCSATDMGDRRALAISVRDCGAGFGGERLARAFEPFWTTKTHGTGLGLPIIRRIVEAHGGSVSVANSAPHGAVIEMVLPREE